MPETTEPVALTALHEYAKCLRGDWSDFDGRSNLAAIEEFISALRGEGHFANWTIEQWRADNGICPTTGDHWTEHCGWMKCATEEGQ